MVILLMQYRNFIARISSIVPYSSEVRDRNRCRAQRGTAEEIDYDGMLTTCPIRLPIPPIPPQCMLKAFLTVEKIPAIIILRHSGSAPVNQKQNLCPSPQALKISTVYTGNRVRTGVSRHRNRLFGRHYPTLNLSRRLSG